MNKNASNYIKIHKNASKSEKMLINFHQNASKCIKLHQNTSKYIKIRENVAKCRNWRLPHSIWGRVQQSMPFIHSLSLTLCSCCVHSLFALGLRELKSSSKLLHPSIFLLLPNSDFKLGILINQLLRNDLKFRN